MSKTKKLVYSILFIALLAGNIFFAIALAKNKNEEKRCQNSLSQMEIKKGSLDFMKVFIEKVLQTDKEVDFDTRLDLENKVRSLNSEEILNQWNLFTKSSTEAEAQAEVKKLLLLLISEAEKSDS